LENEREDFAKICNLQSLFLASLSSCTLKDVSTAFTGHISLAGAGSQWTC